MLPGSCTNFNMQNNKNLKFLITASALGNTGDGILLTSLPLFVVTISNDPSHVSSILFATTLPWLLLSPFLGTLVDRFDRKQLMLICGILRTTLGVLLALGMLAKIVGLQEMIVLAFCLGCIEVVFDTSSASILPKIVQKEVLAKANGQLFGTEILTNDFLGKPLGSFLFEVGNTLPFLTYSGLIATSTAFLFSIKGRFAVQRTKSSSVMGFLDATWEGMRWLFQSTLRNIVLVSAFRNIVRSGAKAILVLYALEVLQSNNIEYGILLSASAVGSLGCSVFGHKIVNAIGSGNSIKLSLVVSGIAFLILAGWHHFFLAFALLALIASTEMLWGIVVVSLRQSITPDHLLGRVNGSYRLLTRGTRPIGALLGGIIASYYGLVAPYYIAGIGIILLSIVSFFTINNDDLV